MMNITREQIWELRKIISTSFTNKGVYTISLCGKSYKVAYEGRNIKEDRDYSLLRHLGAGRSCILDVGSNVGISSLLLAENNNARIYSFEASEESARLAIQHGTWNGIADRLTVVNALVTDRSGDSIPFYWEHSSPGASITAGYLGHSFAIYKSSLALDDFVARHAIRPDLIKMDVEGAERMALRGSLQTMQNCHPLIVIELHSNSYGALTFQENAQHLLDLAASAGYEMVYLRTLETVASGNQLDRGRCHVLLCRRGFNYKELFKNFPTTRL
ncbi:MAG: FkbM family methyltransferase [Verrucomicrobiota bacterium]